jgi:hypothetical protein
MMGDRRVDFARAAPRLAGGTLRGIRAGAARLEVMMK